MKTLVAIALLLASTPALACPPQGTCHTPAKCELNREKNRATAPTEIDGTISLRDILRAGSDAHRWSNSLAARITGYVVHVKAGGRETVNCEARDLAHRDTHIELAVGLNAPNSERMIVEVTPTWREKMKAKGIDWSTKTLEEKLPGHKVIITGWMLFDYPHADSATNTNPEGKHDWRATAWEIHPVTGIEVVR